VTRLRAVAFHVLSTTAVVGIVAPARAAVSLRTTVSAHQAEVGEGIRVELSAMSDGESPSNPRLRVPPGFSVQGPSVASSQQLSFSNGHFEHHRGITATWIVVGMQPGHYVIGPPTVDGENGAQTGQSVNVEIVAQGALPRQQQQQQRRRGLFDPSNPFDPFGMMQRLPGLDDLDDSLLGGPPEAPAEYMVEHAADRLAFLRATVTPTEAVVGQQVTLRVYAYGGRGPYDEIGSSEPSRADFLAQVLVDSSYRQPRYIVTLDDERFSVVKLREVALFPLHAGTLTIGSMRMGFRGPGYPETQPMHGLVRESPELHVVVKEPPVAGRPSGYELGDVGSYQLSAEVEPRRVEAGDAVAATIRLEGTGNLPHHVKLPEVRGVEWLEPTITDGITTNDGLIGGNRTFRHVVRLEEPGTIDLGEVTLPFYDPRAHRYGTARAHLGKVEVSPGKVAATPKPAASTTPSAASRDPFDGLGGPRDKLGPVPASGGHLTDSRAFWALLACAPMSVVVLGGLAELTRRVRRRMSHRAESLGTLARRALDAARAAESTNDRVAVAGAVERAVYTSIEDRLGLKARAVLRTELRARLGSAGADDALAQDVATLLDACDALRFAGGPEASPGRVVEQGASVVARLERLRRAGAREATS
jgi:hypothetical protein